MFSYREGVKAGAGRETRSHRKDTDLKNTQLIVSGLLEKTSPTKGVTRIKQLVIK
jgi:hypothetical protein